MERRVLIAVFLCFVVLYAYQAIFVKTPPPKPKPQATSQTTPSEIQQAPAAASQPQNAAAVAANASTASAPVVVGDQAERTISVDTRVVHAVFSNRGGELVSWRLKQYMDDRRQPVEMVVQQHRSLVPRPFTLKVDDPGVSARLDEAFFRVSSDASAIDATRGKTTLAFEYQDASGLHARKAFTFDPNTYIVEVEVAVDLGGQQLNPFVMLGPSPGNAAATIESSRYLQKPEGILFLNGSIQRIQPAQLKDASFEGDLKFAGADDQYFVSAVLPKGKMRVEYRPQSFGLPGQPNQWSELVGYSAKVARATPGMRVFIGPKDFDQLKAADPQMVRVINFGIFAFLAVPLLRGMTSINAYVGNYGWSIIILTILINVAMFPLRHKSMVSMKKMQKMQPQIKAIQDRYAKLKATDPAKQKMNSEMMALYKEHGVNPASGCIPMLLTMPLLFAFYSMLSQAIEVRGQPFAFWLHDLSRHDPYYILPILMGVTMVWQQKMTPSSADPAQQKMMMFMPIFMTALFLWAPSGLALYFLFSNLLAIGQQYITNNMISSGSQKAMISGRPPSK